MGRKKEDKKIEKIEVVDPIVVAAATEEVDAEITEKEEIEEEVEIAKEDLHESTEELEKGCGCKVVFSKAFPKGKFPGDTRKAHEELVKEWALTALKEGKLVVRTLEQKGGTIISEVGQKP